MRRLVNLHILVALSLLLVACAKGTESTVIVTPAAQGPTAPMVTPLPPEAEPATPSVPASPAEPTFQPTAELPMPTPPSPTSMRPSYLDTFDLGIAGVFGDTKDGIGIVAHLTSRGSGGTGRFYHAFSR